MAGKILMIHCNCGNLHCQSIIHFMFKMKVDSEPFSLIHFHGISLRDKLLNIINWVNAFEKIKWNFSSEVFFFLQLVFEGIIGNGYQSDIAIDDVLISSGSCGNLGDCDFEKGTCTWRNTNQGDNFDWLRKQGQTNSQFTGPQNDHTQQNNLGIFHYILCRL